MRMEGWMQHSHAGPVPAVHCTEAAVFQSFELVDTIALITQILHMYTESFDNMIM